VPELKWRIPIDVPTGQVKSAAAEVGKLETGLKHAEAAGAKHMSLMQRMGRVLTLNAAGFHHISLAAGEARAKTGEFLEFIGAEAALEVLKKIGEKLFEIGEEAVRTAAKAERINRVINIAAGGKEMGEATRKWIEQFSKTSEFTEEMNERAYIDLKKVGIGQQQAGLFMKAAADVAAVSADKDEAYQTALAAFSRIQIMGRVQARSLMPLGVGVNDLRTIDRYKHMNVTQLNSVLEKGSFNQNDLFKLIMARAHETKLGQRSADNVDLLGTKLQKLQELPERFFKKLADTKAVGTLSNALDGILTKLDPESPTGKRIFGALEGAFEKVSDLVGGIDFGSIAEDLSKGLDLVVPALKTVSSMVGAIWDTFKGWVSAIERITELIPGGAINAKSVPLSAQEKALDVKYAHQREVLRQMRAAKAGGASTGDAGVNSLNAASFDVGKQVGAGMTAGIKASTAAAGDAAVGLARHVHGSAKKELGVKSPSTVFEDIGEMSAAGFIRGMDGAAGGIGNSIERALRVPAGAAPAGGGSRTVQLTLAPVIHVSGGKDGAEQGKRAADAFTRSVDRATLISLLEQALNAQGGSTGA